MKTCTKCAESLPLACFSRIKARKDGLSSHCKSCVAARAREYWANSPKESRVAWQRRAQLKRLYGITEHEYSEMLHSQNGVCALCFGTNENGHNLAVDHDHNTGKVRALLCGACNTAIGALKEDPELMNRAAEYIRKHST